MPAKHTPKKPKGFIGSLPDPTYDRKAIDANPVWRVAFVVSECLNDGAPMGWSKYVWVAEQILKAQKAQP